VKPFLLDTNVLIALAWPNHLHHREAQRWFEEKGRTAFRTCPITQTGFVRISSNPAFTRPAVTPAEALLLLQKVAQLPGHDFWPDDLPLYDAVHGAGANLVGHRQVTDVYLISMAASRGGVLATFDRGVEALARRSPGAIEIVA
jgi:hypothetical protein